MNDSETTLVKSAITALTEAMASMNLRAEQVTDPFMRTNILAKRVPLMAALDALGLLHLTPVDL